jgi:hypothetical protein
MKKIIIILIIFITHISCKKQSDQDVVRTQIEYDRTQTECDNDIDNLIVTSKGNKKIETIFLDYWLKMSKKEYESYSKNYVEKHILISHNDTLWIHLPNKTPSESQRKQYLELYPKFENDTLVELTLFSSFKTQDYNHYDTLMAKYGTPNLDINCQFSHETIWVFRNAIIEYTESNTEEISQFISYQDIKYAKKKAKNNLEYEKTEERKTIFNEKKLKDSIEKRDAIIDNAL